METRKAYDQRKRKNTRSLASNQQPRHKRTRKATMEPKPTSTNASSSHDAESSDAQQQRSSAVDPGELERMDASTASRASAVAGGAPWGDASNALQGLLRKLGAELDDLLPPVSASHSRFKGILTRLKDANEAVQLDSLTEFCELLSLGTEETMASLSVDVFAPVLVNMLRAEHNPDIMLLSSRAMCHMIDAIPAAATAIVHYDGVPLFCERLLSIEYIDLAEQALQALEKLSHEHPLSILRSGGMLAVLQYVDFFPTGVQRVAVSTAANLCLGLPAECAHFVNDAVPLLAGLLAHHDQRVLEYACLAISRLAEGFVHSSSQLEMLSGHNLLPSLLRLVRGMTATFEAEASARVSLSDATHTMLVRTLATLCKGSPKLCLEVHKLDTSATLHEILLSQKSDAGVDRPREQLLQLLSLADEMLPPLPSAGRLGVAAAAGAAAASASDPPRRRRSERKSADGADDDEEEPGSPPRPPPSGKCERERVLVKHPELLFSYARRLIPVFMRVHASAVSAPVSSKCLSCLSKLIYLLPTEGLQELLRVHSLAALIASLLTGGEASAVLASLQMVELLLVKLPLVYRDKFLREGVFDAVSRLAGRSAPNPTTEEASRPPVGPRRSKRKQAQGASPAPAAADALPSDGAATLQPTLLWAANSTSSATEAAVAERALSVYERFIEGDEELSAIVARGAGSPTLLQARTLASSLAASSAQSASDLGTLRTIANLLQQHEGISTFEFAHSGLVGSICDYLDCADDAAPERRRRLRTFCHVFLGAPLPAGAQSPAPPAAPVEESLPLASLTKKLHDVLDMTESLPLVLSESASPGASDLESLVRPFRLRLQQAVGASNAALREYTSNVVLIEPLATVSAIEDFLLPRVQRATWSKTGAGNIGDMPPGPAGGAKGTHRPLAAAATAAVSARRSGGGLGKAPLHASKVDGGATLTDDTAAADVGKGSRRSSLRSSSARDSDYDDDLLDDDEENGEEDDDDLDEEDDVLESPELGSSVESSDCVHDFMPSPVHRHLSGGSHPIGGSPLFRLPDSAAVGDGRAEERRLGRRPISSRSSNAHATEDAVPAESSSGTRSAGDGGDRLVLELNGHALPSNMIIFRALRLHSNPPPAAAHSVAGRPAAGQSLWRSVHTLTYRLVSNDTDDTLRVAHADSGDAADSTVPHLAHLESPRVLPFDETPFDAPLVRRTPAALLCGDVASGVLHLLSAVARLNTHWGSLYDVEELPAAHRGALALRDLPMTNQRLDAKLSRQLHDAFTLCSRSLPAWCSTMTAAFPFLYTFSTRRLFLHTTAFGLSRALQRLQVSSHENDGGGGHGGDNGGVGGGGSTPSDRLELRLGRLPRQKVRISRARVLDSALKVMEMYASKKAMLEVEYFSEEGTGLGPTLEFYTIVSSELRKLEHGLWLHESDGAPDGATHAHAPHGLFPRPMPQGADGSGLPTRVTQLFSFMGRLVAKALLDNRLVDLSLAPPFFKHLLGHELTMDDVRTLSPQLGRSLGKLATLASRREAIVRAGGKPAEVAAAVAALTLDGTSVVDLGFDFTLPGHPSYQLVPGGADKVVDIDNLAEYLRLVQSALLSDGVRGQISAFRAGFAAVVDIDTIRIFSPDELDVLLSGARERWDRVSMIESLKFDHGYTRSSAAVGMLLDILSDLSDEQARAFLKFVTGSPRLPVGGLARLSPPLTIVLKRPENGVSPDAYLPSVMTCANYLKLPDYSSREVMAERLWTAVHEGAESFLLS